MLTTSKAGHWRRRSWPTIQTTNRVGKRWTRIACFLFLLIGGYHLIVSAQDAREALLAKYTPTIYTSTTPIYDQELESGHWRIDGEVDANSQGHAHAEVERSYSRADLLAHRDDWKLLGSGWEGSAFTYKDMVTKVYNNDRSPFRNCVPESVPELRWPTEISATLLLGGTTGQTTSLVPAEAHFLPIIDYFHTSAGVDQTAQWHLVTPFLTSGTLVNLARSARTLEAEPDSRARQLDAWFRPSFESLLDALEEMHTTHNLCHDDIKLDNIFTLEDPSDSSGGFNTHWLLADLGNARQPDHPYHSSELWLAFNRRDCRANDVLRLMKTYVSFLRDAMPLKDVPSFDEDFFRGRQAWSRLFWRMVDRPESVSAEHARHVSRTIHPPDSEVKTPESRRMENGRSPSGLWDLASLAMQGRQAIIAQAVTDALRVKAPDGPARRWGWVWLLGMPVGECEV